MFRAITVVSLIVLATAASAANAVSGFNLRDSRGTETVGTVLNLSSSGGSSVFNAGNGNPDAAFPDGTGNNFSLVAHGFINVATAGDYTFALNQDDQAFVLITQSGAPQTIADTGCCATSTYTRTLETGAHFISVTFREGGGGESLELASAPGNAVPFSIPTFSLVNDASNSLKVFTEATDIAGVNPLINLGPQGFNVIRQNASAQPDNSWDPNGNGQVNNIAEGEALFALGGPSEAMDMPETIKYNRTVVTSPGNNAFPGGGGDDFVIHASGFIDVLDPDGVDQVQFHVSSDDGFRLRVNGTIVSDFAGTTGNSNTLSSLFEVKDGDFLELLLFERNGGEAIVFSRDFDGNNGTGNDRVLIGDAGSGILIFKTDNFRNAIIPEPTTATLGLIGLAGLMVRRRRAA